MTNEKEIIDGLRLAQTMLNDAKATFEKSVERMPFEIKEKAFREQKIFEATAKYIAARQTVQDVADKIEFLKLNKEVLQEQSHEEKKDESRTDRKT
ncbi:MAG: hypothetical protein PHY73_02010 [Candidatus Omnitrophica bacterium]|nr:hypothetical protein [Candidatus Omnitrophota bacterium]